MKTVRLKIPWPEGLHLRPASRVVGAAKRFRSTVRIRLGASVADARSVLSMMALCASLNAVVIVEVEGVDEAEALQAVAACFAGPAGTDLTER